VRASAWETKLKGSRGQRGGWLNSRNPLHEEKAICEDLPKSLLDTVGIEVDRHGPHRMIALAECVWSRCYGLTVSITTPCEATSAVKEPFELPRSFAFHRSLI
jgi:hypothetical protein